MDLCQYVILQLLFTLSAARGQHMNQYQDGCIREVLRSEVGQL